jgi:N-methylhydantoinase A/oxoprolinase/acetone carboxylase beta subunit
MTSWRVGIDIGGTFTDAALVDSETGQVRVVKGPHHSRGSAKGFMSAPGARASRNAGRGGRDVAAVVHATTVATNADHRGQDRAAWACW